jgi:hypothetical protein
LFSHTLQYPPFSTGAATAGCWFGGGRGTSGESGYPGSGTQNLGTLGFSCCTPCVILYLQKKHSPHSHGDIPSFCCTLVEAWAFWSLVPQSISCPFSISECARSIWKIILLFLPLYFNHGCSSGLVFALLFAMRTTSK